MVLRSTWGLSDSPDISLSWLLTSLTKLRNEEFIVAAEAAGLLLNGKTMDAESSTAEEANKNFRQQRIILRHLACYFGRRLTVPLSKIRELEEGALMPVTDSLDLNGKKIHYWHKDIKQCLIHCLNLDGKEDTFDYFMQFDALDVVENTNVPVLMHTIKAGHIDCAKDT